MYIRIIACALLIPLSGCLSVVFHFGGTYSMPGRQEIQGPKVPTSQPILPRENNPLPSTSDLLDSIIFDLFSGEPRAN